MMNKKEMIEVRKNLQGNRVDEYEVKEPLLMSRDLYSALHCGVTRVSVYVISREKADKESLDSYMYEIRNGSKANERIYPILRDAIPTNNRFYLFFEALSLPTLLGDPFMRLKQMRQLYTKTKLHLSDDELLLTEHGQLVHLPKYTQLWHLNQGFQNTNNKTVLSDLFAKSLQLPTPIDGLETFFDSGILTPALETILHSSMLEELEVLHMITNHKVKLNDHFQKEAHTNFRESIDAEEEDPFYQIVSEVKDSMFNTPVNHIIPRTFKNKKISNISPSLEEFSQNQKSETHPPSEYPEINTNIEEKKLESEKYSTSEQNSTNKPNKRNKQETNIKYPKLKPENKKKVNEFTEIKNKPSRKSNTPYFNPYELFKKIEKNYSPITINLPHKNIVSEVPLTKNEEFIKAKPETYDVEEKEIRKKINNEINFNENNDDEDKKIKKENNLVSEAKIFESIAFVRKDESEVKEDIVLEIKKGEGENVNEKEGLLLQNKANELQSLLYSALENDNEKLVNYLKFYCQQFKLFKSFLKEWGRFFKAQYNCLLVAYFLTLIGLIRKTELTRDLKNKVDIFDLQNINYEGTDEFIESLDKALKKDAMLLARIKNELLNQKALNESKEILDEYLQEDISKINRLKLEKFTCILLGKFYKPTEDYIWMLMVEVVYILVSQQYDIVYLEDQLPKKYDQTFISVRGFMMGNKCGNCFG